MPTLPVFANVLDGQITAADGYIFLTEDPYGRPLLGGQNSSSDLTGETAAYHRWDGINNVDIDIGGMGNGQGRAAVWNFFLSWDLNNLYVGVEGGSLTFSSWNGPNGSSGDDDGDQGDLYIAIDASGDLIGPGEFLRADQGHTSFHDVNQPQAVDFGGWQPTHIVGVEWVDNNSFNNGYANVEQTITHVVLAGEAPNSNNGGFEWFVGYNNFATYEFSIPWTVLGFGNSPVEPGESMPMAFAMYTTYNNDRHDVYDSGPGYGQTFAHEEIGDYPFDRDSGSGDDGLFAGTPNANGVPANSYPGSEYVDPNSNNYGNAPNLNDEIDTIEAYFFYNVPEPGTMGLLLAGLVVIGRRMKRPWRLSRLC